MGFSVCTLYVLLYDVMAGALVNKYTYYTLEVGDLYDAIYKATCSTTFGLVKSEGEDTFQARNLVYIAIGEAVLFSFYIIYFESNS